MDEIEIIDDKIRVTTTVTNEVVGEWTKAELEQSILDYQKQIDYIQGLIDQKQELLNKFNTE